MEDDFTFPTVAAPAPGGRLRHDEGHLAAALPAAHLGKPQLIPDNAAPAASFPLWPFAAPPAIGTAAAPVKDEAAPAPRRQEEKERAAAPDDEERMDLLSDDTAGTTAGPASRTRGGGHPELPLPERRAEARQVDEKARGAAGDCNERMDLLWESFNEELARSKAAATADCPADWCLLCRSPSDAESDETSSASSPRYGCAPTMLRASSRAGGAGQFCVCSSPCRRRRRGRGAAAGWALLLRLFRRLFAVDRTAPPTSTHRHSTIYVP